MISVARCQIETSITKAQDAMRSLFKISRDLTGNLPPTPGVFPITRLRSAARTVGDHDLDSFSLRLDPGVQDEKLEPGMSVWRQWCGSV